MAWSKVSANPERFEEAMDWFESRVPIEQSRLDTLTDKQRDQVGATFGHNHCHTNDDRWWPDDKMSGI